MLLLIYYAPLACPCARRVICTDGKANNVFALFTKKRLSNIKKTANEKLRSAKIGKPIAKMFLKNVERVLECFAPPQYPFGPMLKIC